MCIVMRKGKEIGIKAIPLLIPCSKCSSKCSSVTSKANLTSCLVLLIISMSSQRPSFLFLFFLFLSWAPPTILSLWTISHLPGFHGPLPFHLETGYVGVNDVELYYYFINSERNPSKDPLLLWLTGGPGCSSFSGLAFEMGPVTFKREVYNGQLPTLVLNPYSWTKFSNILFLDSPAGAGFSFTRSPKTFETGDISSSIEVHKFLREWFVDHPEFLPNPLYIGGSSYGGKVVPIIAHMISEGIEAGLKPHINLKGYVIGNPVTGEKCDAMSQFPAAHGFGIISDELYKSAMKNCQGESYISEDCGRDRDALQNYLSEINSDYILDPLCAKETLRPKDLLGDRRSLVEDHRGSAEIVPPPALNCRTYGYYLCNRWANNEITRETLHIQKGTTREWRRCRDTFPYAYDVRSSIGYQKNLTSKGYRALVYSGDHDMVMPFLGTEEWVESLNSSIVDNWRSWKVDGQVAGYTRAYANNLTFATVKGAGHTAPEYKGKECLAMFQRWISHNPL